MVETPPTIVLIAVCQTPPTKYLRAGYMTPPTIRHSRVKLQKAEKVLTKPSYFWEHVAYHFSNNEQN